MDDTYDIKELRKRAEDALRQNPSERDNKLSEADKLKLIHELEVYKVELEMQQQELLAAKEKVDSVVKKYNELFDLHNRFIMHLIKKDNKEESDPEY